MQLVLLSGLAGSGKSVALKVLEDAGYFAVDNLPTTLIPALVDSLESSATKIAISIDARSGDTVATLPAVVSSMAAVRPDSHRDDRAVARKQEI